MNEKVVDKKDLIAIRDYLPSDHNLIMSTWLKGLRYGNEWFEAIESKVYFAFYHNVIETILNRPQITIKVACLKDDPEVVLGYAVYEGTRVDWVFIKKVWRGIGIAKSLLPGEITTVSHLTNVGKSMMRKRPDIIFNPFALSGN